MGAFRQLIARLAAALLAVFGSAAPVAALSKADQELVAETVRLRVWGGFDTEESIYEVAQTNLSEPSLSKRDQAWIRAVIAKARGEKKTAQASWPAETDCDRLDRVFETLERERILGLHNVGVTQSDALSDAGQAWHDRGGKASGLAGYAFYHEQDVDRVMVDGILYIGYGTFPDGGESATYVARRIVDALKTFGFQVEMPSSADERILVKNIDWKKRGP